MDVSTIDAGRDFRQAIDESVAKCAVLLAVIGPEWLNATDENGARRLDDAGDYTRIETASALRRDIPLIPVLVRGARMPRADQLPAEISEIAYRNAVELTHVRWKSDVHLLMNALRPLVGEPRSRAAGGVGSRIDSATLQNISRELAAYIGPIAELVVKRAAAHCSSVEEIYRESAAEIETQGDRGKFLAGMPR